MGLYGDPTISWFIAVDATFSAALEAGALESRAEELLAGRPSLGADVEWSTFDDARADETLTRLVDRPLGDGEPVLRVARHRDGTRLVVAIHHGSVDGFGLLAVLGALAGMPVVSASRGIGERRSSVGFVRGSVRRLGEALVFPPTRLAGRPRLRSADAGCRGDVTARVDQPATAADTSALVAATVQAVVGWNRARGAEVSRVAVAVAASRRDGADARPDRDTAYLRIRLGEPTAQLAPDAFRLVLQHAAPEPTFPERSVRVWSRGLGVLVRRRLGSTMLVSNLGRLSADGLESVAFYPAAAGVRALAVGLASTSTTTTVTVRLPAADFSDGDAATLCAEVARGLRQRD